MKRCWIWIMLLLWLVPAGTMGASGEDDFIRGLVYFHMDDLPNARKYLGKYFRANPGPQVRQGYMLMLDGKDWDATKRFKSYLDINHRSAMALVGIALSTRKVKNSNTMDNLERAIRLHPRFAAANLCLGFNYLTQGNYPDARIQLERALRLSGVAEVKILLANLHIRNREPITAEKLVRGEADANPDNFYYNYLTAWAMVEAGHIDLAADYLLTAHELSPGHENLNVLRARYFYFRKKYREALLVLKKLKIQGFNEDYLKTYSKLLMALKDHRKARPLLYRLFRKLPWDMDVNLLMGQYFSQFTKGKKEKARHWKQRTRLCGGTVEEMNKVWPDLEAEASPEGIRFFTVRKLIWVGNNRLYVVGRRRSGEAEKLYSVDPEKKRVLATLNYRGNFLDFHYPQSPGPLFFSSAEVGGENSYLYSISGSGSRTRAGLLTPRPMPFPRLILGVNHNATLITVTDERLDRLSLESPFSVISQFGRKTPVYPTSPFHVFMLNTRQRRWTILKSEQMLETVPIPAWRRYRLIQRAIRGSAKISELITKGQGFDISSPEVVRVIPAGDGHTVLVYLADLENSFQGVIYDTEKNREIQCSQSMFLGGKSFADVDVKGFDPEGNRILFVTRDQDRQAILFDYSTRLYQNLGFRVVDTRISTDWRDIYLLSERGNRLHAMETRLSRVHLSPYVKMDISPLRNIVRLGSLSPEGDIIVWTYDGERIRIIEDEPVEYLGISFEGATHEVSADGKRTAAFINGRLLIIPSR